MQPQDSSPAVAAPASAELPPNILLELVREMRGQRESFDEGQRLAAAERKSERRWRMLFQALVFGAPVLLGITYFLFFLSSTGFRSGKLKAFLNPFTPVTPEVDTKAQRLVDQLGVAFLEEVKARRGSRLKQGVDVATGEVWPGPEAKDLGLVDAVGTIDQYVSATWGLRTYDFGPNAQSLPLLGRTLQDVIVGSVQRLGGSVPEVR